MDHGAKADMLITLFMGFSVAVSFVAWALFEMGRGASVFGTLPLWFTFAGVMVIVCWTFKRKVEELVIWNSDYDV